MLTLAIYYPFKFYLGKEEDISILIKGSQRQVVGLIRTLFLKRFESSKKAFEESCIALFIKLLAFVKKYDERNYTRWRATNAEIVDYVKGHILQNYYKDGEEIEDFEEDFIPEEFKENIVKIDPKEYDITKIVLETIQDLNQLAIFIKDFQMIQKTTDDKLQQLISILKEDKFLKDGKVIIFTEYLSTAQYLYQELRQAGFTHIDEVDSTSPNNREEIISTFSPYYNGKSTKMLQDEEKEETRILIATDVLAEGLNLQDATLLINYDIHWNPVRLLQRIGRVDRRLNAEIEQEIVKDHPDRERFRGKTKYWNFLPPKELDDLLNLYKKVSHKTLLISKVFGIQGKKLLTPEDDFDALKEFNHEYEGDTTVLEKMRLLYQNILHEDPSLERKLANFPLKVFSGKWNSEDSYSYVFFCYNLPGREFDEKAKIEAWTEKAGFTKWYLYNIDKDEFIEEPANIIDLIKCEKDIERIVNISEEQLKGIRKKVEDRIRNTYLKSVQAPIGVKPILKSWMAIK